MKNAEEHGDFCKAQPQLEQNTSGNRSRSRNLRVSSASRSQSHSRYKLGITDFSSSRFVYGSWNVNVSKPSHTALCV